MTIGSPVWQAHPHANRPVGKRLLSLARGRKRIARPREGDEECVSLRVYLDAAVRREGGPQRAPVLGQRLRVGVSELVQQLGRALDVGEEKGDGAGGELAHPSILAVNPRRA